MKSISQILKIKAALLYILKSFPLGVDYIKLFKILYFAQREHLVKYGRPIVDESFYALKHGPVPSFSYKALQAAEGKLDMGKDFEDFLVGISIKQDGKKFSVSSHVAPDTDELSNSDISCLDTSILNHKDTDSYDLSELSHDRAWRDTYAGAENDPEKNRMTLIDIAKAGGASEYIINHIREHQFVKKALA